jgi:hypothetical protein
MLRNASVEKGAEIGSPTLAHPFRWRLRNVGVRDGGIIRLPNAGASALWTAGRWEALAKRMYQPQAEIFLMLII